MERSRKGQGKVSGKVKERSRKGQWKGQGKVKERSRNGSGKVTWVTMIFEFSAKYLFPPRFAIASAEPIPRYFFSRTPS